MSDATTPTAPAPVAAPTAPLTLGAGRSVRDTMPTLSRVAASLKANYTVEPHHNNVLVFPRQTHIINVTALRSTFSNLLHPIVTGNFRAFGARTPIEDNDVTLMDNVIYTVSVEACFAAHAVAYNKAKKIDTTSVTAFGGTPILSGVEFTSPLTALIESLGPYQIGTDFPHRMLHVPAINLPDVLALRDDPSYVGQYYQLFLETTHRSKLVQMAVVDANSTQSSPWWTLFPNHVYKTITLRQPSKVIRKATALNVFSPVPWEKIDTPTTIAALFIETSLLARPGITNFSCTKDYFLPQPPSTLDSFPEEAQTYPYFDNTQSTFVYLIEAIDYPSSQIEGYVNAMLPSDERSRKASKSTADQSASTSQATAPPVPTPIGTTRAVNEATKADAVSTAYRVKYFYYDHKILNGVNATTRTQAATQLSQM